MGNTVGSQKEESKENKGIGGKKTRHRIVAILVFVGLSIGMPAGQVYAVNSTIAKSVQQEETQKEDFEEILDGISYTMDLSMPSGISKEDYVKLLKNCPYDKNGVLGDQAELIWDICHENGKNELIWPGLIAWESGWCDSKLSRKKHNIMSITGSNGYKSYDTYEDCIKDGLELIFEKYLSPDGCYYNGDRLLDIAAIYTGYPENAENWAKKVASCARMAFSGELSS